MSSVVPEMNEMQQAVQVPIPHSTSGINNNNNQQLNNPLITSSQAVQIVPNIYGLSQSSSAGGQDIFQEFFRYVGQSQALVDESATQTMSHIFVGSTKTQSPVVNVINGNHDSAITSIRDQQNNNIFASTISLCNGYSSTCRTPYPTPDPSCLKPFEFINSHVESREQVVLNCQFNDICNEICFVHGGNNNEHFYDIVFDYGELLSYTTVSASPTTIDFEVIDTGVSGINILAREFGVYLYERNIANNNNEICNDMINGRSGSRPVESRRGEEQEAELFGTQRREKGYGTAVESQLVTVFWLIVNLFLD